MRRTSRTSGDGALLERFGDVFTRKDAVVVDVIEALS